MDDQLTDKVEIELLKLIDKVEFYYRESGRAVESDYYIQLADHYHYIKKYKLEADVLNRYLKHSRSASDEIVELQARIERVLHLQNIQQAQSETFDLQPAYEDEAAEDNIVIASSGKSVDNSNSRFFSDVIKVLTLCTVYSGKHDDDEIIQLAMVLFEFDASQEHPLTIIEQFVDQRRPKKPLTNQKILKFGLDASVSKKHLNNAKIISLFRQVDLVVSHNDADIERKLLAVLVPEIANFPWYSTQKDIPWKALGFDTRSLSQLCLSMGLKRPKTALERARAICKMLEKLEPGTSQTYLERLYHAKPMHLFEWTPELIKQKNRLAPTRLNSLLMINLGFLLTFVIGIILIFLFF